MAACAKCHRSSPDEACFCMHCGKPLNDKGLRRQLGWKVLVYDICLPGYGHYCLGYRKVGLIIMGAVIILSMLYALDSARIAMHTATQVMSGGSVPSAQGIAEEMARSRGFYNEMLFWTCALIWIGAIISSVRLCLVGDR